MAKTRFKKIIFIWVILNLTLLVVWVGLLFLVKQKSQTVAEINQLGSESDQPMDVEILVNPERQLLLTGYFLNSSSTVIFLEDLEQLGQEIGVDLTIGQATEQTGQLGLNLSAEGDFGRLGKFLNSLELLPYAIKVNRVELRQTPKVLSDGRKAWRGDFFLLVLQDKNGE